MRSSPTITPERYWLTIAAPVSRMDVVSYIVSLTGLVNAGRLADTTAVFDEMMRARGIVPDLETYSTLVRTHVHRGGPSEAMGVRRRMLNQGITPDAIILNAALTGCTVRATRVSDVSHVLDRLLHWPEDSRIDPLRHAGGPREGWRPGSSHRGARTAPQRGHSAGRLRCWTQQLAGD